MHGGWIILFVVIGIFLFSLPIFAYRAYDVPETMQVDPVPGWLSTPLKMLGIPKGWQYYPAIWYLLVVPFIGVYVIIFGLLREMKIFTSPGIDWVNWVLAFAISFSILPLGFFVRMVSTIFATIGMYGTLTFAVLFIFGLGHVFISRMTGWFPGKGAWTGLAVGNRYDVLTKWLQDAATRNPSLTQITQDIHDKLNQAQKDWKAQHHKDAVRKLESDIIDIRNKLDRAGGSAPSGP